MLRAGAFRGAIGTSASQNGPKNLQTPPRPDNTNPSSHTAAYVIFSSHSNDQGDSSGGRRFDFSLAWCCLDLDLDLALDRLGLWRDAPLFSNRIGTTVVALSTRGLGDYRRPVYVRVVLHWILNLHPNRLSRNTGNSAYKLSGEKNRSPTHLSLSKLLESHLTRCQVSSNGDATRRSLPPTAPSLLEKTSSFLATQTPGLVAPA